MFRIGIYSLLEICGCSLVSLNGLIEASFKLKDHQDLSIHVLFKKVIDANVWFYWNRQFEVMGANRKEKSWESR